MTVTTSASATLPYDGPTPLADVGLIEEAQVYDAMWRASGGHCNPRDVDELYLWEIGTMLGRADELIQTTTDDAKTTNTTKPADFQSRSRKLLHERIAHAKGRGPKPEAQAIDGETLTMLTGAMNGST